MATTFSIKFGNEKRKLSASPLTIIYYNEEFSTEKRDADLLEDYFKLVQSARINQSVNAIKIMQIVWACEKTYTGGIIANFNAWVKMLGSVDFTDADMISEMAGALQSEFFPDKEPKETSSESKENETSD